MCFQCACLCVCLCVYVCMCGCVGVCVRATDVRWVRLCGCGYGYTQTRTHTQHRASYLLEKTMLVWILGPMTKYWMPAFGGFIQEESKSDLPAMLMQFLTPFNILFGIVVGVLHRKKYISPRTGALLACFCGLAVYTLSQAYTGGFVNTPVVFGPAAFLIQVCVCVNVRARACVCAWGDTCMRL